MTDSKSKRGKPDRDRISFSEQYEIDYWTKKWKISSQQLHGAHRATGSTMVAKIEKYLKEKGVI
jgi:hypothetical protein